MCSESESGDFGRTVLEERRDGVRFKLLEVAFVFLGSNASLVGPILNVSEGGLCCRYVASQEKTRGIRCVEIFLTKENVRFEKFSCSVSWDEVAPRDWSMGSFSVRHCGIQFEELTTRQRAYLHYFIQKFSNP